MAAIGWKNRRSQKGRRVPLCRLHAPQILRELRARPRRLEELFGLLHHEERFIRGRAALAIARLSEVDPKRLSRSLERVREGLGNESAYVRWNLAHALGQVGAAFPKRVARYLPDLCSLVDDQSAIARSVACASLARIGRERPALVLQHFESVKREIPPALARGLRSASRSRSKTPRSR